MPMPIILALIALLVLSACAPVEPAEGSGPESAPPPGGAIPENQPGEESNPTAAVETGTLRGQVTFYPAGPGPTQKDVTPEFPPEAFEGRAVSVFRADGETLIAEEALDEKGAYEITLPAGTYVVGITLMGIEQANSLPPEVVITAGETTVLDIVIDSGLR